MPKDHGKIYVTPGSLPSKMADHPPPNYVNPETRQPELLGVQISMTVVADFIVCLRLYTRKHLKGAFGLDDWTILAAMVS